MASSQPPVVRPPKKPTVDMRQLFAWPACGNLVHPLVLMFALSGGLMIGKTLRIPKLSPYPSRRLSVVDNAGQDILN